jgi:hypothetical protein
MLIIKSIAAARKLDMRFFFDFNLALGVKWRAAMHQAEDLRTLNDGQYGSRSNRNATDPVFIEELQCEISRATRKPVILTNYDATACYDRIIPNLGMLVSQKYGVHESVTSCNAATLEQAEYRIKTELGLASTGYKHNRQHPIFGTGQGSATHQQFGVFCQAPCSIATTTWWTLQLTHHQPPLILQSHWG